MIPVNEPHLGEREAEYVAECLRTGWISSAGRFIDRFEEEWARYCGRRFGVAVANGTLALEAAVRALDLEPGDEVIIPTFTIISCAQAVVAGGGVPVLVDADPATWCMDASAIERRVTTRTRAIMPVHIYGHPVDMDVVTSVASRYGLTIVEDAAEAHGAEILTGRGGPNPAWRRCGSFGAMSCFSFYANKIITTGEGGMVVTDDAALAERLRSLRNLCFRRDRRFYHTELGSNYRLTNVQAAIGVAQIERIDAAVARKRAVASRYAERLGHLAGLTLPVEQAWARNVYWMYGLVLDESTGFDADTFAARLRALDVETRPFFLGMHEQPVLRDRGLFAGESYPIATRLARQGLYLPSGLALTDAQVDQVAGGVERVLTGVTR
ncbi:MAG TPA: DegT/DnrJ/EryC1/StrS family aminotransferase [Vicinamibacterales bacterium]|nr:DegT/DnrJ/EryC1/StrS family aminotransferase [Vicinamibacterales bacterium]